MAVEAINGAPEARKPNAVAEFFRGPWCIAMYTYREGIRKKILIGFLILSLLVIFGASFISTYLPQTTVGETATDINLKFVKDLSVSAISVFGILITIFISAMVVPTETENKVVYTVLSKPVSRVQYLLGKFLGVQLIVLVNLGLMGGLFVATLLVRQGVFPTLLLWSIFLTYLEFLIVSAFTFAVSCAASSAILPTICGLFIYFTGHMVQYLEGVVDRAARSEEAGAELIANIAKALYYTLPNLEYFSLRMQIVERAPNDPLTGVVIPQLLQYSVVYAVCGFFLAYWIFRKKEL